MRTSNYKRSYGDSALGVFGVEYLDGVVLARRRRDVIVRIEGSRHNELDDHDAMSFNAFRKCGKC